MITRLLAAKMLAWAVIAIGALTIFEYAIGHPLWSAWTGVVPIASGTAVGFVAIGAAILLLTKQ